MVNINPYYSHPFVSNSALTKLKHEISGADYKDLRAAFRRGTILDAFVTQPETIPALNLTDDEKAYGAEGFKIFISDPYCLTLHRASKKQVPFYIPGLRFRFNNTVFEMDCKCLYDGLLPPLGWDIKNTQATTLSSFIDSCFHLDYFRGRAFYMECSGLQKDMLIGVNIDRRRVFKVPISVGDKYHLFGYQQCQELAYKYWALKAIV